MVHSAAQQTKGVQKAETSAEEKAKLNVGAKPLEAAASTAAASSEAKRDDRVVSKTLSYLRGKTLVNEFGCHGKSKL